MACVEGNAQLVRIAPLFPLWGLHLIYTRLSLLVGIRPFPRVGNCTLP